MKKFLHVGLLFWLIPFLSFSQQNNATGKVQNANSTIDSTNTKTNASKFLSAKKWAFLFPNRFNISKNPDSSFIGLPKTEFYSFKAFIAAAKLFPKFLSEGDESMQKRELAAFLANISHETNGGWDGAPGGDIKWGLYFVQENGFPGNNNQYSDFNSRNWMPIEGKSYHGRGPLQLSWNYNYGQFSEAFFSNKQVLLNNPDILLQDPVLCFASAIWFWMSTQYPKPSCHDIITGIWQPNARDIAANRLAGFGAVVNVINGGLECGTNHSDNTKYRYDFYQNFCNYLIVNQGPNASCANQKPFGQ